MINPTYSYDEVRFKIIKLDYEGLIILGDLLEEENDLYKPLEFEKLTTALNYMISWLIENQKDS